MIISNIMTKLRKLGFTKLAKETLPKTLKPVDIKPTVDPERRLQSYIDAQNPRPKPLKPSTQKILRSISKDLNAYKAGDKKVWDRKYQKIKTKLKEPKNIVGAGAGVGLYLASKKNPKLENFVNLVADRKINFINKPKQKLSLKVPTSKDGTWRLNWSKAF